MADTEVSQLLERLNTEYLHRHQAKEDLFWSSYMGLTETPDATRHALGESEVELNRWLQDPDRLKSVRAMNQSIQANLQPATAVQREALAGWERTLDAHAIESAEARALAEEIVYREAQLASARASMQLGYQLPGESLTQASSVALSGMVRADKSEARRKAAWEGLRSIETHVLQNGFLEVVKLRNRLGRMLGGEDYYDWKTRRTEGMTKREIFELLYELDVLTRDSSVRSMNELRRREGDKVTPWNVLYLISGDVTAESDPYYPFALSLNRWARSFSGMGCDYRGARLVLDLLDRKGKYENGFMHGPEPAWRSCAGFHPARIHFTANAIPTQIGAGERALETFFHEGGHAVHFSNVDMPSPCFAQEFAPTSVAYAEIQSMFMDSLISDPDWLALYATNRQGERFPFELLEKIVRAKQPFRAWQLRAMMVVPYLEREIYEMREDALTPENVLQVARAIEVELLGQESHRPVFSVPHLLAGESSAYYHGYVLADMGVYQTRDFLLQNIGSITDNPFVGTILCDRFWKNGNQFNVDQYMKRMTGEPLSAKPLGNSGTRSVEKTVENCKNWYQWAADKQPYQGDVHLNATIKIVHGNEVIADTASDSFDEADSRFRAWIDRVAAS